jgi:quinol monooxygenase YgiN
MITQLARFETQSGKEIEAHEALQKMTDAVRANEPGCLMYAITRGQVNPREIYVYEIYEDNDAFEAHRRTDHVRELQSSFDKFLDRTSFNVEMLAEVAGFIRKPVEEMTEVTG